MGKPAIYLRVSSEIQKEKESIKSQEMALTAWLATQGLTPDDVGWYRDDGVSGKEPILGRGDAATLAEVMKEYADAAVTTDPAERRMIAERLIAQVRVERIGKRIHRAVEWQRA